jgi:hypothetical protein
LNTNYAHYKTPKRNSKNKNRDTQKVSFFFPQQPKIPQKNKNPPSTRKYLLGVNHDGAEAVPGAFRPMSASAEGLDSSEGFACSFSTAMKKTKYCTNIYSWSDF